MRVLVAMSGGVDSAVTAARCVAAGHDVVGVHLALSTSPQTLRTGSRGCCSREDAHDARRVADLLGIPFYVWDFADKFKAEIIEEFVASYEQGDTPNPCVRCNEKIKFEALAERALALGFDAIATGHYARLENGQLRRAIDNSKDQSYVLASLTPHQLSHSLFPLGDTVKTDIRLEAESQGLSVAKKPDSHDICFIPSGDTRAFLGNKIGIKQGDIIDQSTGKKVAEHNGTYGFTIGQRKGLGLVGPAADGQPRYVTSIDAKTNTVTIGKKTDLEVWELEVDQVISHHPIDEEKQYQLQVRAHGATNPAQVRVDSHRGTLHISLGEPLLGVATGQTAVVYAPDETRGDLVVAAGKISHAFSGGKHTKATSNAVLDSH